MPSRKLSSVAAALHRRFRPPSVPPPESAPAPALPPESPRQAFSPEVEELTGVFRRMILEKWSSPEHATFRNNDINHARRYALSLSWLPDGEGRLLDPAGGSGHFGEALRTRRRYTLELPGYFNLEKDRAPYDDESFDGVLLMEVLEHFTSDPMFAMAELNRVLKPGGFLLLTTPNLASWCALHNLIYYRRSPYLYGVFIRQGDTDRHNREYTVDEIGDLARAAGFGIERLEGLNAYPAHDVVPPIPGIDPRDRGDTTFCLARKQGPVRDRYPGWLYATW